MYKLRQFYAASGLKRQITSLEYIRLSYNDQIKYEALHDRVDEFTQPNDLENAFSTAVDVLSIASTMFNINMDSIDSSPTYDDSPSDSFDGFDGGDTGGGGASADY